MNLDYESDNKIVTVIDPSINSLGFAIFVGNKLHHYGTIKSSLQDKQQPLQIRIQQTVSELAAKLPKASGQTVVIEEPEMFNSGTSSAAVHNSSLKKLIMVVGAIIWHGALMKSEVVLVPVTMWKGQLPKHVTTRRSEEKFGVKFKTSDEADAVSLGDWYLTKGSK